MLGFKGGSYTSEGMDSVLEHAFRNVEFEFLGFKGRALELQSNGWEFTVSKYKDAYFDGVTVCFHMAHDLLDLRGFSSPIDIRALANFKGLDSIMGVQANQPIKIQQILNKNFNGVRLRTNTDFTAVTDSLRMSHTPIDFSESIGKDLTIDKMLSDIPFAKVNLENNFEIYLSKKDEKEIMDLVLQKQDVKQKEIRQNERRREYAGEYAKELKKHEPRTILKVAV